MATTVILGSGIIGVSTAYYLLQHQPGSTIHLVDASPELFASASGYAGGFLAKDWFRPSLVSLGELSYEEHRKLAEEEGGREKWGYVECVTVSYEPRGRLPGGGGGEDWLLEGSSRAGLVERRREVKEGDIPDWLKRIEGDNVSVVDDESGTSLVNPLRLCQFLLEKCKAAGVHIYYPATAISIRADEKGELSGVCIKYTDSSTETEIPATRVLFSAGAWTPQVFTSLFKDSTVNIPVESLAGHSLVVKAPEGDITKCHSVYATMDAHCPEIYFRPNGVIYVAGVNSSAIPLPSLATGATPIDEPIEKLKAIARQMIVSDRELEVVRKGLCFRPITSRGTPFIARLDDEQLGGGVKTKQGQGGGVFVATGHGPWGITLSLGTGRVVAEIMHGKTPSADVSGFGL